MDFVNSSKVRSHVETLMRQNRVPGLSIAVFQDDQVHSEGFGLASVHDQSPCTADSLFDIASSSKALTATAITLLVEDEHSPGVKYDSVMSELLPDDFVLSNDSYTRIVTVDDLLGHQTGMPGHDDSYMGVRAVQPDDALSITRNLRNLAHAAPPRLKYIYCNMMYTVLTHLIEVKKKQPFDEFLQERIFDPLGMNSSSLQPQATKARGNGSRIAKGHIWDKTTSSYREFEAINCPEGQGAGSIVSSANDFIKWIKALIDREGPITENVYKGLTRSRSSRPPNNRQKKSNIGQIFYTAGMEFYQVGSYDIFGHSGDITGFGSRFVFIPGLKFGAVVMGNSSGTNSVAAQLFRGWVEDLTSPRLNRHSPATNSDEGPDQKQLEAPKQPQNIPKNGAEEEPLQSAKSGDITVQKEKTRNRKSKVTQETDGRKDVVLVAYTGKYWNIGYKNMTAEIRDEQLYIDATDRSLGFTARLEHKRDGRVFDAQVRDAFGTGYEVLDTEFVIGDGNVLWMGMDLEPLVNDLIWFERVDNYQQSC
ncbi:hypothetical protein FGRMN_3794 [Fusarium graminum]|nr:hypothetical protein FGRMN_3794 [Fusarium graminum]